MPLVLLVDDEPLVLIALARSIGRRAMLKRSLSVAEAFELLASGRFDAVVSDYWMPDMDGLALLRIVQTQYPDARRILMSAGTVPNLADHVASGVVEAFLDKPFTGDQLMKALGARA